MGVNIKFILGEINEAEVSSLEEGYAIISKMILAHDDYNLFQYKTGDSIQVETDHGYRVWCTISHLEVLQHDDRFMLIFTLVKDEGKDKTPSSDHHVP